MNGHIKPDDVANIIGVLLGAFGSGYVAGLLILYWKKSVDILK